MQLLEATWDTRNLGMTTQELIIEPSDQVADIRVHLERMIAEYQVVRVVEPVASVTNLLAEEMFIYSEQLSFWECTLGNIPASTLISRLPKVETHPANPESLDFVFQQINSGLFRTDRISKDPDFGVSVAGKRYVNWLRDEIDKGAIVYVTEFRQKRTGFFCLRLVDGNPKVALSGVFPETQVPGMGLSLQFEIQKTAHDAGCSTLQTVVSTDNTPALRAHIAAGFLWKGSQTVFTRKRKPGTS